MGDVHIQITCRQALDEALELAPWDEETQIAAFIEFIELHELDDEFQDWIVNKAREEKAAHNKAARDLATAVLVKPKRRPSARARPASCGDPACPGWGHFLSDTYGWEVEACDECVREGRFGADVQAAHDAAIAQHSRECNCGMGEAKCAPGTPRVAPWHCYATEAEMERDYARREEIATRLEKEGRL